jgi:hypothetical protein
LNHIIKILRRRKMKKEIENKKGAKEKIKKHLNNLAIKKSPYVVETAN